LRIAKKKNNKTIVVKEAATRSIPEAGARSSKIFK